MFHVPQENTYSLLVIVLFIWPRTRACSNLVHFYVCVCIWPINSWERNIKIVHMIEELSISPSKSANFSIHSEAQLLRIYVNSELFYPQDCFLLLSYRNNFLHHEAFVATALISYWWSCTSFAGVNCPVYFPHIYHQTLSQIMLSETTEWILYCIV